MKAKLFIRGMKEPVELEREEAIAAQTLIASAADPKTPFSIEGVIATKKEDMKFVVFDQQKERTYTRDAEPMEEMEAKLFEHEMIPFRTEAVAQGFKEYNWPEFYLQKEGVIRLEFFDLPSGKGRHFNTIVRNPDLYSQLLHKLDSFHRWKGRKEFVEKKRLEELQALEETR